MNATDELRAEEQLDRRFAREQAIFETLDKSLPVTTRIVMANDFASAETVEARVRSGAAVVEDVLIEIGSFARMDFLWRMQNEGFIAKDKGFDLLPRLWPGADPDDTDPRFLRWWRAAFKRRGAIVTDEPRLPRSLNEKTVRIFRGQREHDKVGISWSLSEIVAERFAAGAAFRARISGVVLTANVPREAALAYLTARDEREVIVDLRRVKGIVKR